MTTTDIRGAALCIGDVVHTGHSFSRPITVTSFDTFEDVDAVAEGWFLVLGTVPDSGDAREPYRQDEWVTIDERPTVDDIRRLIAFRNHVRSIVHAGPDDGDVTVLDLLRKDHDTAADLNGCADCD